MKQRGRVYVCDLAGTEPAGDIFYANYQKLNFEDGSFEYKLLGKLLIFDISKILMIHAAIHHMIISSLFSLLIYNFVSICLLIKSN